MIKEKRDRQRKFLFIFFVYFRDFYRMVNAFAAKKLK
jgi:hypothetical protein